MLKGFQQKYSSLLRPPPQFLTPVPRVNHFQFVVIISSDIYINILK